MAIVQSVSCDDVHRFSKRLCDQITLLTGLGVQGDAHCGATVKHRSRVRVDPSQPNLRQVHLIQAELFDELAQQGFAVGPADLGENILTRGLDLMALPRDTVLHIGVGVQLRVTGLRNPCAQIEAFQPGLLSAVRLRAEDGQVIRKAGIMSVVLAGGVVRPGDPVRAQLPQGPHHPLERV